MTEDLEIAIKNGNIFRHKSCERCGAVDYEKLVKCMDRRAEFETHGFGIVNITVQGINFESKQFCLCNKCAEEFEYKICRFMEEKDIP